MSSRAFKTEHGQGYPASPRAPLHWDESADDGDDGDDGNDDEYDPHSRRYSTTSEYASNVPYGSRVPVTTVPYGSYGYPAPTTSHAPYASTYAYGNQHHSTPYSPSYTSSDARSLAAYRPHYPNAEYPDSYSTTHPSTPAITYTHAPTITTSAPDWNNTSYSSHGAYGNSNGHSPAGYTMNGMTRSSSQRSDGNRSQNSNDGKDRRFICNRLASDDSECAAAFVRKADLTRHIDCVHNKQAKYSCPVRNCSRKGDQGFTRRDHRTEHLRHFHHRDIPKRPRGNQHMDEEDDEDVPF